jgi:D-alanyl-D-alanine carboxypeptidase (penicillin-binding protein 5/6)
VAIASVAKVMTAYVILHDHPLSSGESGPEIAVQSSEAAAYPSQVRDGDSLVPVVAGERLTERQALEALHTAADLTYAAEAMPEPRTAGRSASDVQQRRARASTARDTSRAG